MRFTPRKFVLAFAVSSAIGCHGGGWDTARMNAIPKTVQHTPHPSAAFVIPDLEPAAHSARDDDGKKLRFPSPDEIYPAQIYAALDRDACFRELQRRLIPHTRVAGARGVDTPIRLTGPLHGVRFYSESRTDRAVYETLDCRLALALDDFSVVLALHGVVEAVHMSIYRPWTGKVLPRSPRKQHEAALAIDLGSLVKADGSRLVVLDDFHGRIGAKTCGEGATPDPATPEARELREIVCTAVDAKMFTLLLTPNYNAPHKNHFHLEVMRNVKWFMVD